MNPRFIAANVVDRVTNGYSLTESLNTALVPVKDVRDRAFIQAICYGICRYYTCLDLVLSELLQKPMKEKDSDVHTLLLVGLYQLMYMRVPPHAAVAETVNAAAKLHKPWARGLVNAILREYLRQHEAIMQRNAADPEMLYAHPRWWIDKIKKSWPDVWQEILAANNAHPPLALRVNARQQSREAYLKQVTDAQAIPETQAGVVLATPKPIEAIEGFATGVVSVQDGAAQLAAELLEAAPGQHVLDACAAPGGKLTHILELVPDLAACVAVEKDAERIVSIKENLTRLNLTAKCICADVGRTDTWWDGQLFERILLDAPCSASGVIRRHPDIKLLRQSTDIKALAMIQTQLLTALWPLLAPGGVLVYATCSIFPEENTEVLQAFLARHPDAREKLIQAAWGEPCAVGRQILPGRHDMDGFYYARLVKSG